ncbi:MAG: minor capsid protein [Bacteroidaceae bacterium]|nr:minor capsid protein [Bacteroidaceae bacterium]
MATDWSPFLHLIYNHNSLFSGIKTFHELNEAFPSLLDEEGNTKPFERFLNDVQKINNTYNGSYLRTEYNFARNSSLMAAKWKAFEADGDRYHLQYRTAGDERVRASHQRLNNITLPITSRFWDDYLPPNGYGCRCTVVQVRKGKHPLSDEQEALNLASQATAGKHQEMMKFNPGKEMTTFPAYNAYTRSKCKNCKNRPGNISLAADIPNNELCAACEIVSKCAGDYTKSQSAIRQMHFLHEMEPLLSKKVEKMVEGKLLKIGFTKEGNKHLYSDTFGRTKILTKEMLKELDTILRDSEFIDDAALTKKTQRQHTAFLLL